MRTLELNKQKLWVVDVTGDTDVVDSDGFYTGEFEETYTYPYEIYVNLYPYNSKVHGEVFGISEKLDMIAIGDGVELKYNSLLFLEEPSGDYDINYTYKVNKIAKSLNVIQYGLIRGA